MSSTQLNRKQRNRAMKFTEKDIALNVYVLPPKDIRRGHFKFPDENRKVDFKQVERLKSAIEKHGYYGKYTPIIVDKDNYVLDGQHSMIAATYLELPIYVVVCPDPSPSMMSSLNQNQKNWGLPEFANFWINQTNDPKISEIYRRFEEYKANYNISRGVLIAIYGMQASRSIYIQDGNADFKEGRLSYNKTNRKHIEDRLSKFAALENAALTVPIKSHTLRKQQFQEAFLQAFARDCFKFERFLTNLCRSEHQFNKLAKKSDMYKEIVRIEEGK